MGAGLLDAVLVDVERGVEERAAVLEGDAFLVAIGVYSIGEGTAQVNSFRC